MGDIASAEAEQAALLGSLYREIQNEQYACSKIICAFPHDGNCWCFNTALARHTAKAIEAGTVETERLDAQHESAGRKALPDD